MCSTKGVGARPFVLLAALAGAGGAAPEASHASRRSRNLLRVTAADGERCVRRRWEQGAGQDGSRGSAACRHAEAAAGGRS